MTARAPERRARPAVGLVAALLVAAIAAVSSPALSATRSPRFTHFVLPTPDARPYHIAVGSDGNLWVTELEGSAIARVTPRGHITEFPLGEERYPHGLIEASDGAIWFAEQEGDRIGRIATDGAITEYALPAGSHPEHLAQLGPLLFFTETGANKIGTITLAGALGPEYVVPTPSSGLNGIAAGSDNQIYFAEQRANKVGRLDPVAGTIQEFPLADALHVALGPDGNVWVTEQKSARIARITPAGVVTQFRVPSGGEPNTIAPAADGKSLWFTESPGTGRIARISVRGFIREWPTRPRPSGPVGVTVGPDGRVWLADDAADAVVRVTFG